MSKSLAMFFFAAIPLVAWAAPDSFTVDTTNSSVNFAVDHLGGIEKVRGAQVLVARACPAAFVAVAAVD